MNRNFSLDSLKFVCAVLIVFLHMPNRYQAYYLPLTRCAVPCFFILSGFFLAGEKMEERMRKGCKRMLRIIVFSSLLFALSSIVINHFDFRVAIPSLGELCNFIFLNENPWGFHLWYLGAYLYVLIICILIDKYQKWAIAFFSIPLLLATDLAFGKYSLFLFNHEFSYLYVRNFLFVGLPYFMIGVYMKRNLPFLIGKTELIWAGVIVFCLTSLLESRLLVFLNLNPERDHYLSSTPLAVLLFMLFYNIKQKSPSLISKMGERDSLYIYVIHPLWMTFFYKLSFHMPDWWNSSYAVFGPLLIIGCTIITCNALRIIRIIR